MLTTRVGKVLFIALILASWALSSTPRTPSPGTNGCGPHGFGLLFPEFWFEEACDAHDICYQSGYAHSGCDEAFYRDMIKACEASSQWDNSPCMMLARLYYMGVRFGNAR